MQPERAKQVVEEIFDLYVRFGEADYIGEEVSQIQHMYQAAQLAEKEGYDDEVVLASFFHDIGHLCEHLVATESMDGYGVADHEPLTSPYFMRCLHR